MTMRQLWHSPGERVRFTSRGIDPTTKEGWRSLYYGVKEPVPQIEFHTTDQLIETTIKLI
jgi:hypothetical protein